MVDPPEKADASDISNDEFEMSEAPSGDDDIGNLDDLAERASEIDDVTDSMLRRAEPGDDFDAIVGEIDYSDVDVPALLAEREEYKGLAQRIQADFDNYRRRAAAQSLAEADRASGRLAEALLPVLDAAEAAYLRHPEEVGPLLNQMLVELKKHGLETLDLEGKPFDPEFAEAVAHEPGDGGEPIVAEVLRSGYTWKGKVLRAAMVKTKD
ncbi:MAG: nucleotide exchange factor GrpE [Ilumatobacteraceae bacterium]